MLPLSSITSQTQNMDLKKTARVLITQNKLLKTYQGAAVINADGFVKQVI